MTEENTWVNYVGVAASSEGPGTSVGNLSSNEKYSSASWESGRFSEFPVEVVVQLNHRTQLSHLVVSSKPEKVIPELEVYVGDGLYGSFVDSNYHFAGKTEFITQQSKQVSIYGIGNFLKLVFTKKPKPNPQNPHGQVSLGVLRVWGRPISYNAKLNQVESSKSKDDTVDKILMSMGVPLELLMWSKEDHNSYRYAPIDEDTRETIIELDSRRNQAYEKEDFGALKHITNDIKILLEIGTQLLQLKRDLSIAVAKEDYDTAIGLKNKITLLEKQRDEIDALYETQRYEKLVAMEKVSEAHMAMVNRLLEEEQLRADMLKKQREDEYEKQRKYLEELERKRQMEERIVKRKAPPKPRKKPPETKEEDTYKKNEGDDDLELYLRPLLNEAGGKLDIADVDTLKRVEARKILAVLGVKIWSCLYSENWRHREAAIRAVLEFLEAPLITRYQNDTRGLFKAAVEAAVIACGDKVLPIYFTGLKVMITAMSPPVCDNKVTPKMVNEAMKSFIPILITKVSELNSRARDVSMHTLIELFRHPQVKIGPLVDYIMKITTEGPVAKQPWRLLLCRFEILLHIIQEYGVNHNQWNWQDVFHKLIVPCLGHASSDVRQTCVEVIVSMYKVLGMQLRVEVDGLGKSIKPQLSQTIYQKMLAIDQQQPMQPIKEEPAEHSAQQSRRNWSKLKEMITSIAQQSPRK